MARAADQNAQDANNMYKGYATGAVTNYNADQGKANADINSLEGEGDPYKSKDYLQNQNILTSGAMNSTNTAAKTQLNDTALRTGTNTASLGRTIASNARAGQRTMDDYNATTATGNVDKSVALQQGLIGARQGAANSEAGVFNSSSGRQVDSNGQLVQLNGQNQQMWGNIIGGVAGGAGAAFAGKA